MAQAQLVVAGTPWEVHDIDGVPIYVKREDLSCPVPGPSFSKIRGLERFLSGLDTSCRRHIGVLDTLHSKAGWGAAYICQALDMICYNFYPVYKREWAPDFEHHLLRHNQQISSELGAHRMPLVAGMSAILFHQAKAKLLELCGPDAVMLPNGLKLDETVRATADEVEEFTPTELFRGTWVVSISSGTICAGVLKGLEYEPYEQIVAHMGYSRSQTSAMSYLLEKAGVDREDARICFVDEGYSYANAAIGHCPFPCNAYYDLKAWQWLKGNVHSLVEPIVFWNIGA